MASYHAAHVRLMRRAWRGQSYLVSQDASLPCRSAPALSGGLVCSRRRPYAILGSGTSDEDRCGQNLLPLTTIQACPYRAIREMVPNR